MSLKLNSKDAARLRNQAMVPTGVGGVGAFVVLDSLGRAITYSPSGVSEVGGDGSAINSRSFPVVACGNHSFIKLASGGGYTSGLKADGSVWSWGQNVSGVLGTGDILNKSSPTSQVGGHLYIDIAPNETGCAFLKADGSVWSVGLNYGANDNIIRSSPVSVVGNHSFIKIAGNHIARAFAGLKSDGSVWTWGTGFSTYTGYFYNTTRSSPTSVIGSGEVSFSYITIAGTTSLASYAIGLSREASWSWGIVNGNPHSNAGDGVVNARSSPVAALGTRAPLSFDQIYLGGDHSTALDSNRRVLFGWGSDGGGQPLDKGGQAQSSPASVFSRFPHSWVKCAATWFVSLGLDSDGTVWTCGTATSGQTGTNQFSSGVPGALYLNFKYVSPISLAMGGGSQGGLISNLGETWTWGTNGSGQLGDFTVTSKESPVRVLGPNFDSIHPGNLFTVFRKGTNLWTAGSATDGRRGDGVAGASSRSSPILVVGCQVHNKLIDISAGVSHSIARHSDGTTWAWGTTNLDGRVGVDYPYNSTVPADHPRSVVGDHSFIKVLASTDFSLGLKIDGTVWSWGVGTSGTLGTGDIGPRESPTITTGNHSFVDIATCNSTIGLKSDGSVWAWGANDSGQLGDLSAQNRSSPTSVVGNHSFVEISTGQNQSYGRKIDGTVWAWGLGTTGQLGTNAIISRSSPTSVIGNHSFVKLFKGGTANEQTGALKQDFSAWTWGLGTSGQLGQGITIVSRSSPVSVINSGPGGISFTDAVYGNLVAVGLDINGSAWAWGSNAQFGLADATNVSKSSPTSVVNNHSFVQLAAGNNHFFGRRNDGGIMAWGAAGPKLGIAEGSVSLSSPLAVTGTLPLYSFIDVVVSDSTAIALNNDGTAWAWGLNTNGPIGDGTETRRSSPTSVLGGHSFIKLASSGNSSYGLKIDGSVWAWGLGTTGQLGDNTIVSKSSPVSVFSGGVSFSDLAKGGRLRSHMTAVSNGVMWSWGLNSSGQLGDNTITNRSSPVSMIGAHSFVQVFAQPSTCLGHKADFSLWATGDSSYLPGHAVNRSSPVSLILPSVTFTQIGVGGTVFIGLDNDSTAWTWGGASATSAGQGGGFATSPGPVTGTKKAFSCIDISGGNIFNLILDQDGRAWTFGNGADGKLGNNTITGTASPTMVAGSMSFSKVACQDSSVLAIRGSNNTAWTWGDNTSGQLGIQAVTSRSSPVSVAGNHSFIEVAGCPCNLTASAFLGLKSDGTCWAWGLNTSGQCGDGSIANRSSPVSVIGNHSFIKIACGGTASYGLKINGSIWAWGNNTRAQIGDGTPFNRSSPVLVSTSLSFSAISAGRNFAGGLSNYKMFTWGDNYADTSFVAAKLGQGQDFVIPVTIPTEVWGTQRLFSIKSIHVSGGVVRFINEDNTLWTWGVPGGSYEIGDGFAVARYSPVSVLGDRSVVNVCGSSTSGYLQDGDGGVWTWGDTAFSNQAQPFPVEYTRSYTSLMAGSTHALAFAADDQGLYAQGVNTNGQLGVGTVLSKSTFNLVYGSKFNGLRMSSARVFLGTNARCIINDLGEAYSWGPAYLGTGDTSSQSTPVSIFGSHSFTKLALSNIFGLGLKGDGTIWGWGGGGFALGVGQSIVKTSPFPVVAATSFVNIAASKAADFFVGLRYDGSHWGSGTNTSGELGDGTSLTRSWISAGIGSHSFRAIACGNAHTIALKADGSAWAWGAGASGELGQGTVATARTSPVSVIGGFSFVQCAACASSTFGLREDGTVWSWGVATNGQLGTSDNVNRSSPVSVFGNHSFIKIAAGINNLIALKLDGSAWGWGGNGNGQIGDDTVTARSSPVSVVGNHSFTDVDCAGTTGSTAYSMGLKSDGSWWGWGVNDTRDFTATPRSSPVAMIIPSAQQYSFTSAVAGNTFSMALHDKKPYGWGLNTSGQLGNNTITNRSVPVSVIGNHSFELLACGAGTTLGLKVDGSAWGWGIATGGVIGDNAATNRSSPVSVVGNHSFTQIAVGLISVGLKSDGSAWSWGPTPVGDGTAVSRSSPVSVSGNRSYVKVIAAENYIMARMEDGSLWAWGSNSSGAMGVNVATNQTNPALVFGTKNIFSFNSVTGGNVHTIGLLPDGTAFVWGSGLNGRLGDNLATSRSSPVSVVGNHIFQKVSAGDFSMGLKPDGTLWSWGLNTSGQLGDNTIQARSSPISVIGSHSFVNIFAGSIFASALKSDGSIWTYGTNTNGVLGDNSNILGRSSPVSVIGNHSFILASPGNGHMLALKEDGSVWSWGLSDSGALGQITSLTNRSSPVSVVGQHSFVYLTSGSQSSFGLKTDGTAWSWGLNSSGQLGNNTTTNRSSPVSVIGNHSFIQISSGTNRIFGLKEDGTVWGWGENTAGYLGVGDLINRSSPTILATRFTIKLESISRTGPGGDHLIGLNGTNVWSLGLNTSGQIGDNSATNRSILTTTYGGARLLDAQDMVGSDLVSLAIDQSGGVWSVGGNSSGGLASRSSEPNTRFTFKPIVSDRSFSNITANGRRMMGLSGGIPMIWGADGKGATVASPVSIHYVFH